jgi:hypothetical protein
MTLRAGSLKPSFSIAGVVGDAKGRVRSARSTALHGPGEELVLGSA